MNTETIYPQYTAPATASPGKEVSGESRYFALDSVRTMAMLLGVLYHAMMYADEMFGGSEGGSPDTIRRMMDWVHPFRMPLFFLLSGFFCNMMFKKYGIRRYLAKRWVRIFIPFLLVLVAISAVRYANQFSVFSGGSQVRIRRGEHRPPPGFAPQRLKIFDLDKDGAISAEEWKQAQLELKKTLEKEPLGCLREAGYRPDLMSEGGSGSTPGDIAPGGPGFGPIDRAAFQEGVPIQLGQSNPIAEKLVGSYSRHLYLSYLWFLWYLLVFATSTPFFAMAPGWVISKKGTVVENLDQYGCPEGARGNLEVNAICRRSSGLSRYGG
jgi:hypothetical protein